MGRRSKIFLLELTVVYVEVRSNCLTWLNANFIKYPRVFYAVNTFMHTPITAAVKRKISKCRGTFSATYTLLPLVVWMHGTMGSDSQALIKVMTVIRVDLQDDTPTGEARGAAKDRERSHLCRCFSFSSMLQQDLSQRTRRHLRRQGVVCMDTTQSRTDPKAMEASLDPSPQQRARDGNRGQEPR